MTAAVLATLVNMHRPGETPLSPDELNPYAPDAPQYPQLSTQDSMELLRTLASSLQGGSPHENSK